MCSELLVLGYIDPGTGGLIVGWLGVLLAWLVVPLVFVRKHLITAAKAIGRFVQRHWRRPAELLVAGLVLLAVLFHSPFECEKRAPTVNAIAPTPHKADRVLALGLDGADPRVLKQLMDSGHLPNMKLLADHGSFHPLAVPNPAQSPVVWAALATGQNPGRNGIYDFIGRDPKKYQPQLSLLDASCGGGEYKYPIRAKAFWDVATAHGVDSVIVRWPMTFPPPAIKGRMLAGLGVPDVRGALGRYTFYSDGPLEEGAEGGGLLVSVKPTQGVFKTELLGPQVRGLTGVKAISTPLTGKIDAERKRVEVTLGGKTVTLEEKSWSDLIPLRFESGLFSKYSAQVRLYLHSAAAPFALLATSVEMAPSQAVADFTSPKEYGAELEKAIGAYHTLGMPEDVKAYGNGHMDEAAFLELCRKVELERRAMLMFELQRFNPGVLAVVFDTLDRIQHMTPYAEDIPSSPMGRYLIDFDAFLGEVQRKLPERTAVVIFSDHGFSEFRQSVDLNRWLADAGELSLDETAFKSRKAKSSGELYAFVDWEKTQAYAVGFAGIFVNVEGREGKGVVPEAKRREVAERIKQKLEALVDPQTSERIIHRVYHRDELYEGAALGEAPDLVIGYRPGYRGSWQSAVGGVAEDVITPNEKKWQRDHIVDASFVSGSLLTSFPVEATAPHAYDLAPTFLSLLGLPVPPEMEGHPLNEATGVASQSQSTGGPESSKRSSP